MNRVAARSGYGTILHQWWKSQGEDLRKALGGS
jgi:hypothetical protein